MKAVSNLGTSFGAWGKPIHFPPNLPVSQRKDDIQAAIKKYPVVIVCGETGSGKTTQLPKMCLDSGRGLDKRIVHTQPRRIAATATARRIAEELETPLGEGVGYAIRFKEMMGLNTRIVLVTDGILLAQIQHDPLFLRYDTIIIDEAHERNLNIDFLLGYLKTILPQRPDLKLIVTSATLDAQRFAQFFASADGTPAPIIEVSGRLFPVEVRYLDPADFDPALKKRKQDSESLLPVSGTNKPTPKTQVTPTDVDAFQEAALQALLQLFQEGPGDVLFFLPGEREIHDMSEFLRAAKLHADILPLFARLNPAQQEQIFKTSHQRRVVLSTNIAETSLTVPGIRYVLDSGLARVKRYSYRNKVEMLHIERIAQAQAAQRTGRCGRVANGVCIRLFSETDFSGRPEHPDPEILRTSLASVILRMKHLGLMAVEEFPFLNPPLGRAIADGYQVLTELGALDEQGLLTATGRKMAHWPLDPKIARMLIEAERCGALSEIIPIAAALATDDPRERSHSNAQSSVDKTNTAHAMFTDPDSEFLSYVKLYAWWEDLRQQGLTRRKLSQHCQQAFINERRLREWFEVSQQLRNMLIERKSHLNQTPATFDMVHISILSGLLSHIGLKHESEPHYMGTRGIKFFIHPGSALFKKASKWVVAGQVTETSQLYARTIAKIQPVWLERVAAHLIHKSQQNPHWEKNQGQAVAQETGTLLGLPIYTQRKVSLTRLNPKLARRLLITEGLVAEQMQTKLDFVHHNWHLVRQLEQMEHQIRRQSVLVDDALIAGFYEAHIPDDVVCVRTLEAWAKTLSLDARAALKLKKEDLLNKRANQITLDVYPKVLTSAGVELTLTYHFEPGSPRDGVTVKVPILALNQIDAIRFEWLVRGMVIDKVEALLKSLPQKLRKYCIPLRTFAQQFIDDVWVDPLHPPQQGLLENLKGYIAERTAARPNQQDFRLETLAPHLLMNFKLVDEHERQLDMQRSLATLRAVWGESAQRAFKQEFSDAQVSSISSEPITEHQFEVIPEMVSIERDGKHLFGYPALKDYGEYCLWEVYDSPDDAKRVHEAGIFRLIRIALKDTLKFLAKNLPERQAISILYAPWGDVKNLEEDWIQLSIRRSCCSEGLPNDQASFAQAVQHAKSRINLIAQDIGRLLLTLLTELQKINKRLQLELKQHPSVLHDIQQQLTWLMPKSFLLSVSWESLQHYPRYLKAIHLRLDKLRNDPARDALSMKAIHELALPWQKRVAHLKGHEDEALQHFGWQLQELRVSLFAQELKTPMPVSVKRLQKAWEQMQLK